MLSTFHVSIILAVISSKEKHTHIYGMREAIHESFVSRIFQNALSAYVENSM